MEVGASHKIKYMVYQWQPSTQWSSIQECTQFGTCLLSHHHHRHLRLRRNFPIHVLWRHLVHPAVEYSMFLVPHARNPMVKVYLACWSAYLGRIKVPWLLHLRKWLNEYAYLAMIKYEYSILTQRLGGVMSNWLWYRLSTVTENRI